MQEASDFKKMDFFSKITLFIYILFFSILLGIYVFLFRVLPAIGITFFEKFYSEIVLLLAIIWVFSVVLIAILHNKRNIYFDLTDLIPVGPQRTAREGGKEICAICHGETRINIRCESCGHYLCPKHIGIKNHDCRKQPSQIL